MWNHQRKARRRSEVWMQVIDGAKIRRKRVRLHLSQRQLAYLAKCSQATISLVERDELKTISEDLALEIAYRLNADWEDLFVQREVSGVRRMAHGASSARQGVAVRPSRGRPAQAKVMADAR